MKNDLVNTDDTNIDTLGVYLQFSYILAIITNIFCFLLTTTKLYFFLWKVNTTDRLFKVHKSLHATYLQTIGLTLAKYNMTKKKRKKVVVMVYCKPK